jgi:hypothetical protein
MECVREVQAAPRPGYRILHDFGILDSNGNQSENTIESVTYFGSLETETAAQNPLALKHDAQWNKYLPG